MIGYVGEIEAPWLIEVIAERFDYSAINAMAENSLIYGGAIRDALAEIPLKGDLDIVVSPLAFAIVTNVFDNSSKWARVLDDGHMQEIAGIVSITRSSQRYPQSLNIRNITAYRTVNDVTVQIVVPNIGNISTRQSVSHGLDMGPLYGVVESVDIVCCGLAMDREGRIFEVLEGAHHDCQNRILRFNDRIIETVSIDKLAERIEKLEKRGWKSEIDLAAVKRKHKRVKPKGKAKLPASDGFVSIEEAASSGWIKGITMEVNVPEDMPENVPEEEPIRQKRPLFNIPGVMRRTSPRPTEQISPEPEPPRFRVRYEERPKSKKRKPSRLPRHGGYRDPGELLDPATKARRELELGAFRKEHTKAEQHMLNYSARPAKKNINPPGGRDKAKPTTWREVKRPYQNEDLFQGMCVLDLAKGVVNGWSEANLKSNVELDFSGWERHRARAFNSIQKLHRQDQVDLAEINLIEEYIRRVSRALSQVYKERCRNTVASFGGEIKKSEKRTSRGTTSGRIKNKKVSYKGMTTYKGEGA